VEILLTTSEVVERDSVNKKYFFNKL